MSDLRYCFGLAAEPVVLDGQALDVRDCELEMIPKVAVVVTQSEYVLPEPVCGAGIRSIGCARRSCDGEAAGDLGEVSTERGVCQAETASKRQ